MRPYTGELTLEFDRVGSSTRLTSRSHSGPLNVQRPFYPEGEDVCHVYLLHPPGGLVAGDQLSFSAQLNTGAKTLITTPAANKFYRSDGKIAKVKN